MSNELSGRTEKDIEASYDGGTASRQRYLLLRTFGEIVEGYASLLFEH